MQINGPSNVHGASKVHGAQSVNAPNEARAADQPTASPTGADEVSITQEADFLSRINDIPDIRQERVDQIQAEIASGVYETDEKLDIAISRLLDEIA